MKNQKKLHKLHTLIAKVTMFSAIVGAGLSSFYGYFQTKVPRKIAK